MRSALRGAAAPRHQTLPSHLRGVQPCLMRHLFMPRFDMRFFARLPPPSAICRVHAGGAIFPRSFDPSPPSPSKMLRIALKHAPFMRREHAP